MRVVVASDHRGYVLKRELIPWLAERGHTVVDMGTNGPEPVDYPDYAEAVGRAVRVRDGTRGILICGSGVGASVAANKIPGVRAGLCHDSYSARQGVEHDDMNVLVLGGRVVGQALAQELVQSFLSARYDGAPRHARRLEKVQRLETMSWSQE